MDIKTLLTLTTPNVWLVTLHSSKLTGKACPSPLGDDWLMLMPFDNPEEMLKANQHWNCLDIPAHIYVPDIRVVYELLPPSKITK